MINIDQLRTMNRAKVMINQVSVGILEMIAQDEYRFTYDENYRANARNLPVSLSLPLSQARTTHDALPPFFDNLLMEGRNLRSLGKAFGLDPRVRSDRFRLLLLSAQDSIGAIKITPLTPDGIEVDLTREEKKAESGLEIQAMVSAYESHCPICLELGSIHATCSMKLAGTKLPLRICLQADQHASTFRSLPLGSSISGAQDKNLFSIKKGIFSPSTPSSHIIKPEGDFHEMPANEHLTMTIARRLKFNVPWAGLFKVENLGLLYVVKRFDRHKNDERVLLEDFAQILSYLEIDKENSTFEEIAAGIEKYCSSPMIEKCELFRRILFCFVFGNGDVHLKNWSLMFESDKRLYKLSPVYDWLNVRASMPDERVESVLSLNGKVTQLSRGDFESFASETLKIPASFVKQCFDEMPSWINMAEIMCPLSALSIRMKARYLDVVRERGSRLLVERAVTSKVRKK